MKKNILAWKFAVFFKSKYYFSLLQIDVSLIQQANKFEINRLTNMQRGPKPLHEKRRGNKYIFKIHGLITILSITTL